MSPATATAWPGFYSLAASAVEKRRVSSRVGRNMPEPIPVILLGQLAVDTDYQGRRLGSDLPIDAAQRAQAAADVIGARAIVVQAIDEQAKAFYSRFGFRPFSDREPLMLLLRISELKSAVAGVTSAGLRPVSRPENFRRRKYRIAQGKPAGGATQAVTRAGIPG